MLFADGGLLITQPYECQIYNEHESIKHLVWSAIRERLLQVLLLDTGLLKTNAVKTEILKASLELDMQVINFIVNCLLPYSAEQQKLNNYGNDTAETSAHGEFE